MVDLAKNFIKWISDFTEEQFDYVVNSYLVEVLKLSDYVNTDGTNDGGNDIRIYHDNEKLKIQIQVTIQESAIDNKIKKELENAKRNVEIYGYQKSLFFFYSHPVSDEKQNEFELLSLTYGIKFYLIDAKKIAYAALKFNILRNAIKSQYGIPDEPAVTLNEEDRMVLDFISFGSATYQIKSQIIKSFIVHNIYEVTQRNKSELVINCQKHFKSDEKKLFLREVSDLVKSGIILEQGDYFSLSKEEEDRIDRLKENFYAQEQILTRDIHSLLSSYKIDLSPSVIIKKLKDLFESNFILDKLEVLDRTENIESDKSQEALNVFLDFLRLNSTDAESKSFTKRLMELCMDNNIIQRLSAGKIFTSFADPDAIRNYVNQTDRIVYFDTSIVLHVLCVFYYDDPNSKFSNSLFKSVKDLLEFGKSHNNLNFLLNEKYIPEISYHFKEALTLIPFDELGYVEEFGGSNNVLYNYYIFLKRNSLLEDDVKNFAEFLEDGFEIRERDIFVKHFQTKMSEKIISCLRYFGIGIFSDEDQLKDGYYDLSYSTIESLLDDKGKYRAIETIKNDSNMLSVLADDYFSDNEPIFVTWDLILLRARKKFHEEMPSSRLWHWFTPNRLMNHISITEFNIDNECITKEIISILNEDFDFYKLANKQLDAISKILNIRRETGKKYLAVIKSFNQDRFDDNIDNAEVKEEEENYNNPAASFILNLNKHYAFKKSEHSVEEFRNVFQIDELFDEVKAYLLEEVQHTVKGLAIASSNSVKKMDELIIKSKEIKRR